MRRDSVTGRAAPIAARPAAPAAVLAAGLVAILAVACTAAPPSSATGSATSSATGRATASSGSVTLTVATAAGKERRFVPETVRAPAGAEVRLVFRNASTESHNLSFTGPLEPIRTETIMDPGQEQTLVFVAPGPGTHRFVCTVHPDMAGELEVTAPSPRP